MQNPYLPEAAQVLRVNVENPETKTLRLRLPKQGSFRFLAGQFMMVGLPGFGECPISLCSDSRCAAEYLELTIKAVGELTDKIWGLKKGDRVWLRGPFGNGFPEVTRNLVLIGGGCGYAPLRAVYQENKDRTDIRLQIFFGCRTRGAALFTEEYEKMRARHDFQTVFEQEEKKTLVDLIKKAILLPNAQIFVCGPKPMYKSVADILLSKGARPADIYISLEKRMHCGLGVCEHCAVGAKYVCRDGPIFSLEELRSAF